MSERESESMCVTVRLATRIESMKIAVQRLYSLRLIFFSE